MLLVQGCCMHGNDTIDINLTLLSLRAHAQARYTVVCLCHIASKCFCVTCNYYRPADKLEYLTQYINKSKITNIYLQLYKLDYLHIQSQVSNAR